MTQTLIEQLENLPRFNIFKLGISSAMVEQPNGQYVNIEDLRAIIEQANREAVEPVAYTDSDNNYLEWTIEALCEKAVCSKNDAIPLYTSPQPDHTKLIGELVEALDDANKKIKKAKDFEYQAEMYISDSEFELDGFLGNTAAEISVTWQKAIDANNALLTKAREAIK